MHDGAHFHEPPQAADGSLEQTKKLLSYMIDHNEHHCEELAELLNSIPREKQKKFLNAIGTFEAANVELRSVLEELP